MRIRYLNFCKSLETSVDTVFSLSPECVEHKLCSKSANPSLLNALISQLFGRNYILHIGRYIHLFLTVKNQRIKRGKYPLRLGLNHKGRFITQRKRRGFLISFSLCVSPWYLSLYFPSINSARPTLFHRARHSAASSLLREVPDP